MTKSSKIFLRNRALGYVCNNVPCATSYFKRRKEHAVFTCVGKSYHTYGINHLSLLCVSEALDSDITCIAAESTLFTASGGKIQTWKRHTVIRNNFGHHDKSIHTLLPFGPLVIAIDEGNHLKVWDWKSEDLILELTFDAMIFRISSIVHPSTYLNKVLIGSEQGTMQLWNIKTSKMIHSFKSWNSAITVLEQAPALNVIAVGLHDGRIILHNIKFDETIFDFKQDYGPVTSISFRTDKLPIMATGTVAGHVVLWDLEERKVASQILNAHSGTINTIKCFPNEPLMLTSSSDNSIKLWIFDQPDQGGRLLRLREGHSSQPSCARFYDGNPVHILCSGGDSSLRVFNTLNESLNFSLGKASYNKKAEKRNKEFAETLRMPPITEFVATTARAKEWDNLAALHLGSPLVTTWSYEKRKMGKLQILPNELKNKTRVTNNEVATCLHMSNCGNFITIGYSSGKVFRFSAQSGMQRCFYGHQSAHKGSIRGVTGDPLNQLIITACNKGVIKFWKFKPEPTKQSVRSPLGKLVLDEPVAFIKSYSESNLLCIALDDFSICLVDYETRKVVRKLFGHSGQITDCTFSPDARWLISAGMDSTIRTWDIPTSTLVDIFKVETPCISINMSLTGQYLVTAHVNSLGLYLWTNKSVLSHVSLGPIKEDDLIPEMEMPSTLGLEPIISVEEKEEPEENNYISIEQIDSLVTMSQIASSRWQNLLDLDTIRKRNKAKEIKKPEIAPFFLPTLPSNDVKFDFSNDINKDDNLSTFRIERLDNATNFGRFLDKCKSNNEFKEAFDKLTCMSPSGIDFEINSLSQDSDWLLMQFLKMLLFIFSSKRNFEIANAYLGLFLKVHTDTIFNNNELIDLLKNLHELQTEAWVKIEHDLMYCLCTVDSLKNSTINV